MADPKELANKARTTLSAGLQALQGNETVPEHLLDLAEPIARTMGVLHRIEKADEPDPKLANEALQTVRTSLDTLQSVEPRHPAVDEAMEAVAGSLSKLFALTKALPTKSIPPPSRPPLSKPPPPPKKGSVPPPAKQPSRPPPPPRYKSQPPAPAPFQAPFQATSKTVSMKESAEVQEQIQQAQAARAATQGAANALAAAQATMPLDKATAIDQQAPGDPRAHAAAQQPMAPAPTVPQEPAPAEKERVPGMTDAPVPPGGAKQVSVELGAHSGSNFYKGLSGNDVIEHGGIFVATYQVPEIGTPIALAMLLPGDLEFHADAVVQWTRETRSGDAEPGFGARFTRITPEGRELVYRYVKNREPMFYDDF